MATSSIFHNIIIDNAESAEKFIDALEQAERWSIEQSEKINKQNTYMFISSTHLGNTVTCLKVNAERFEVALANIYKYFGGTMKPEMFENAIRNALSEDGIKLFEQMTGDSVLYFGIVNGNAFIDEINTI